MMWRLKKRKDPEIAPDEIFLDSSNVQQFNKEQFEGRIEKPLSRETFIILSSVIAALFFVLIVRAWSIQIVDGESLALQSEQNSLEETILFAPRGIITDFQGKILAENISSQDGSFRRNYPVPSLGQIIGYVSYPKKDSSGVYYETKETGIAGLEAQYDSLLSGKNGRLLTETDALGKVRSEGTIVPAEAGKTIKLSIDADLQKDFARAIANTAFEHNFIAGAGVIMDVDTGAIRAIVSYPSYDPNIMSNGTPADVIAGYNKNPGRPFLDHACQGVYAPGSIVKPLIASGALTDGIITSSTVINDPGSISIPDPYHPGKYFIYRGWKALGPLDVKGAIAWSSDIFFYTVGGGFENQKGLGIDRLDYWYKQFGLGSKTGIDLPEEADGLIPTPDWKEETFGEPWYLGDTYFTSIGQYSTQVTPIQMARATAAIANGGKLFTPTLIFGQTSSFTKVPVSDSSLKTVREGMRQCVTSALCSALNFSFVKVAAKTGTAETGSRNQYDNSWVEGFFPYDNPKYSFSIVLERGPAGSGSQAVNVMMNLFNALYSKNSPYAGKSATSTGIY